MISLNSEIDFERSLIEEKIRNYFDLIDEYFLQNYVANFDQNLFRSNLSLIELTLRKNSLLTLNDTVIFIPFKYKNKKIIIHL